MAPKEIKTIENPKANKRVFFSMKDLFWLSKPSRVVPQIKQIYPGTKGKTHGDKKLTAPAKKEIK